MFYCKLTYYKLLCNICTLMSLKIMALRIDTFNLQVSRIAPHRTATKYIVILHTYTYICFFIIEFL